MDPDIFLSMQSPTNLCLFLLQSLNLLHLLVKIMKIDVSEKLFFFALFGNEPKRITMRAKRAKLNAFDEKNN